MGGISDLLDLHLIITIITGILVMGRCMVEKFADFKIKVRATGLHETRFHITGFYYGDLRQSADAG